MRSTTTKLRSRLARRTAVIAVLALATTTFATQWFADAAPNHNPVGRLDAVAFAGGLVQLSGWGVDPDAAGAIRVHIYVDGAPKVSLAANQPRPDVARAFPSYGPNRGFSVKFPAANGVHGVCAIAINVGLGSNTLLGCRTVTVSNNPVGVVASVIRVPAGLRVSGWAFDPNTTSPIATDVYVGSVGKRTLANLAVPGIPAQYNSYGTAHGFAIIVPATAGTQRVCAFGINVGLGQTTQLACLAVAVSNNPFGWLDSVARTSATTMSVGGWVIDPDNPASTSARILVDGTDVGAAPANLVRADVAKIYPAYGSNHGYTKSFAVDGAEHTVCAVGVNLNAGANTNFNCQDLPAQNATPPGAPTNVQAWPSNASAIVGWTPPTVNGGAAISGYVVTASPGGRSVAVSAAANQAVIGGLTNGVNYTLTVAARNIKGVGTAAASGVIAPSLIPPQFTPAPVSTSHYVRNLTGNAAVDVPMMRAMGARDAGYNPSNHRYLILLQIGGQDESRGGVLLSATSKFVSYPAVVVAMNAYLDGYATKQKPYAPMTLAVGTNNDVDVSAGAGTSWATKVVNPVLSYSGRYPGITVAGANDMEPGFSATVAESRAWVSGYLRATSARYVFNGSADGCSTVAAGSRCNNGWTMADLQWLGGGAAPTRTMNLPQIYNYAMPLQWKFISLTGTNAAKPRLYFGGPLTEVTACDQAGSCGSITNVDAWGRLWSALSSNAMTKQYDMPHGTDLRIN